MLAYLRRQVLVTRLQRVYPNADTTVQGFDNNGKPALLYRENADSVESTSYKINGLDMSDFVTPN